MPAHAVPLLIVWVIVGSVAVYLIARMQKLGHSRALPLLSIVLLVSFFVFSLANNESFLQRVQKIYPLQLVRAANEAARVNESALYVPAPFYATRPPDVDTLVVVIGESASAARWSLLGYTGNATNAPIADLKNSIATIVMANGINTMAALPYALLGRSPLRAQQDRVPSIMDFAKTNEYKTFVYTNSRFYDRGEDFYSIILRRNADVYYKAGDGGFDNVLTRYLVHALEDAAPKKLIVLHTYGSHPYASDRYPPDQAVFSDSYDNSIRYTSVLLNQWIKLLAGRGSSNSALIYMSDHGVMMPPCSKTYRHGFSKTSIEVPMFIWSSNKELMGRIAKLLSSDSRSINATTLYSLSLYLMGGEVNPIQSYLAASADPPAACDP